MISVCRWHDLMCGNLENSTHKKTELIIHSVKLQDKNQQIKIVFLYTYNVLSQKQIKKTIPFKIAEERIRCLK